MSTDSHYVQACTNGRQHDAREPSLSPLNRGFLYGDAIYEVWRTYERTLFGWDEHWHRLEESAAALNLTLPLAQGAALDQIRRTIAAREIAVGRADEYYVRLQISRGAGAIGLDIALADQPDYLLLVQPNKLYSAEKYATGLSLSVATRLKRNALDTLNPAWKTGNYLNNILCLKEARSRGADEVVILNQAGNITEAAVSNIAFVRGGEVLTPPRSAGLLAGITRGFLLSDVAPVVGVTIREVDLRPADFASLDECFLLSTTKDITPVAAIDDFRFKIGANTVTARLKQGFADFIRQYVQSHPQLQVT
jgi:branched-chain amino acid aminotransferase